MKTAITLMCVILMPLILLSQDAATWNNLNNVIVKNQKFEIYASRNGEQVHKSTKELNVLLNYVTGEFYCGIQQKDLQLFSDEELPDDVERPDRAYMKINGIMPVESMQYDVATDQQYKVEMSFTVLEQEAPVVFDVYVKNYQQSGGFRQFIGSADLNLRDVGMTEFVGYDPNLKLVFSFQAFSKTK